MKKILSLVLILLLVSLFGCGGGNKEVPDSVIEKRVNSRVDYLYGEKTGYQGSDYTVTSHEPNAEDHTDTVTATITSSFPYGKIVEEIQFIFQYDRASDLWSSEDYHSISTNTVFDKTSLEGKYSASWKPQNWDYGDTSMSFTITFNSENEITISGNTTYLPYIDPWGNKYYEHPSEEFETTQVLETKKEYWSGLPYASIDLDTDDRNLCIDIYIDKGVKVYTNPTFSDITTTKQD